MSVRIDALVVADPPDAWRAAGFRVDDDAVCRIGAVGIRLVGTDQGSGIVGWSLGGAPGVLGGEVDGEIDGIPTTASLVPAPVPEFEQAPHPNGVIAIDHVVLMSPDLARTVAALAALGVQPRRERDAELGGGRIRQIFYRFAEVILEVVGSPDSATDGPSSLWGVTCTVADIDVTAAYLGPRTSPVKDAVQPGRRITTLRHGDFGMSVRTALIS